MEGLTKLVKRKLDNQIREASANVPKTDWTVKQSISRLHQGCMNKLKTL